MQNSDDEEDFLSADEDAFEDEQDQAESQPVKTSPHLQAGSLISKNIQPCDGEKIDCNEKDEQSIGAGKFSTKSENIKEENVENVTQSRPSNDSRSNSDKEVGEEDGDEEEEALVERIRERNLKIARKFSAEIAKHNKASAPIPVAARNRTELKVNEVDYQKDSPGANINLPPAPPPTPALSTSYNNLNEQSPNIQVPSLSTQYAWRVPPRTPTSSQPGTPKVILDQRGEQARLALDKLSEKLTQSDKNLFEKVAADIKKVSIRSDDTSDKEYSQSSIINPSSLPIVSDLSSIGGWGWSSASKLISSASQVTSQVSSVFDLVLDASQNLHPSVGQAPPAQPCDSEADVTETKATDANINHTKLDKIPKTEFDSQAPNEAFVDFTLNAMESLGKKAFNVMTERDQSGSIQIKGLGRPWEHLLNLKKSIEQQQDCDSPKADLISHELEPEDNISEIVVEAKKSEVESQLPTTLKSRKRRNYED